MEPLIHRVDGAVDPRLFARLNRRFLKVGRERFAQSHWTTFWYPFSRTPSNAVEQVIDHLRKHLEPGLAAKASGVEWWLGRMDTRDVPIDLHADRDNHLFDARGEVVHPRFSSVLYMNPVRGGCLVVSAARVAPDEGALTFESLGRWEVARPRANRLVWFAGHRVHGVLDARNQIPRGRLRLPAGRIRRSLVMNWWDLRPQGVPEWDGRIYPALFSR